jgi:hypothetical protein
MGGNWLPASSAGRRRVIHAANADLVVVDVSSNDHRVLARDLPFDIRDDSAVVAPDGRTIHLSGLVRASDTWMAERERQDKSP